MKSALFSLIICCALLVGAAAPALAETVLTGSSKDGAFYQIVVPDAWNGDLVIWNHGFTLEPGAPDPDLGPLVDIQLAEGYAVAASSYQQVGWAVFKTNKDLEDLYKVFRRNFGRPGQVFVTGASLGGIVTAAAIEKAKIGNVVGAFPICGALAGSRNWDGGVDFRLVYDAVCNDVPGAAIPGGAEGLPEGSTRTFDDNVLSIDACFGLLFPPGRTAEQQARLDKFLSVTQIPESFIITDIGFFSTFGLSDLVHDRDKLKGRIGAGNANVDYGDAEINAVIERASTHAGAANKLRRAYTPSGDVGDVKIISLHTDKDGLVIVENESEYAEVVPADNLTVGVVVEDVPSHCGFTAAETLAGWEALRGWVAGAPQPGAADLQGLCLILETDPLFDGPCRIDPTFVIPDMDGRIRPRD